ncbi:MAG: methyltransferase domain-containing protein [Nitrospinae bacterium]|nr:methyltransferase domain-containing protein [Nitrospinota bacterium]
MAERLASYLPQTPPPKILELGCGTGVFTRHLLTMPIAKLTLNDISPAMIDTLKSRLVIPQNTKFLPGNAEKISLGKADLICANAVFQWFQNSLKALTHLKGSLNKNGTILFSTFGPETLMEFRQAASLPSPINLYSIKEWKGLIKKTGFKLNCFDVEKRKTFNPNTLNLIKNLQQIGAAPIKMFNAGGLRKLIRDYDRHFSTDQGVYSTWELYYFSISH